jgi:branched-chain amino acid transport system substrate-binding protein
MIFKRRVSGGLIGPLARACALAGIAGVASLTGCDRTPDVVRIGVAQPLSGDLGPMGQDLLNGAQMAVDEINAAGGVIVRGKAVKLEIVAADDKGSDAAGDAAAHKLVADDVEVAIADLNSGVSMHAAPIYAAAHTPQLAISTKPEYTHLGFPTTLRLVASDDLQSRALGSFAVQVGLQHYAVVDDGSAYGKGLADTASKVITALGKPVELRRSFDEQTTDFAALVKELGDAQIDLLVTTLSDIQVDALMQQLTKGGLAGMTIVGADAIKTDMLLRKPVPIRALYATSSIVDPKEFAGGKVFVDKFRAIHKADPVYGAHYAYDAVYVVADAISRNGSVDKLALIKTLKAFDGNCPMTNSMRFGQDGEQRYATVAVYELRGGSWDPLMRSDRW